MTVAFVLSGGANLGASQAGMLEALYEQGLVPDMLVGTSVGAINGGYIASRPQTTGTARSLQRVWLGLTRGQIFPASPLTAGLGLLGLRDHSVPVGPLRRLLRSHLEIDRLEQADIPLYVVAADILTGEEVLLSEGPAVDAILASAAIPGVFPAVEWQGRTLVDGGVVNNTPISHAVELGADHVVVLPAITTEPMASAPRGALGAGVAAVSRAICWRFAQDVARYSGMVDLTVLPSPRTRGILPTDFGCAGQLIGDGRRLARTALSQPRPLPARPQRRLSLAQAA